MDQGIPHHCRHRLDGRDALFAAAVRLPLRGRKGLGAVGNLQDDGAASFAGHYQPGDGRDVVVRPLARLERT